ncbi:MAG TPA: UbiA-like polyprenyltransferase [Candidatus Brocadiales bacterium]|nr:UbiA-like polyprenyltransferase [Candidatus Brocadiales bacterium]
MVSKVFDALKLIKFSHTIFSAPFMVMSAFLAEKGMPSLRKFVIIIIALVSARSCAMAFNRLVDLRYDIDNPRTSDRAVLQQKIGCSNVWLFMIGCVVIFVLSAYALNWLSFVLSPVALGIILGYSYTKRFTSLSHLVLGLALAIAPVAAWIGIKGEFSIPPFIIALAVMLWVTGFDIIYSCQDVEYDRGAGLYSLPKKLGIKNALRLSLVSHILTILALLSLMYFSNLHIVYFIGVCLVAGLLFYEHSLVKPDDLSRVNTAFFTVNGLVSLVFMGISLVDIFIFSTKHR